MTTAAVGLRMPMRRYKLNANVNIKSISMREVNAIREALILQYLCFSRLPIMDLIMQMV